MKPIKQVILDVPELEQQRIIMKNIGRWQKEKAHRVQVSKDRQFQSKFNRVDERATL